MFANPDDDYYTIGVYNARVRHEEIPSTHARFECESCLFLNNQAMSIARGIGSIGAPGYEMLSGGYGGALAVSQGLRYQGKLKESTLDNEVGYRISRAYGSHGRVDVKLDESTFEDNFAWRDGGALFASGGKTAAVNEILHVDIDN
jgi:hypothetical protein